MSSTPFAGDLDATRADKVAASRVNPFAAITNEHVVWAGVLLVALVVRAWNLGDFPLSNAEAAQSLSALSVSRGGDAAFTNPFFGWLQAMTFAIFGASEISARAWSVIAGVALCAAPMLLRHRDFADVRPRAPFGSLRAVALAGLLAIAPSAIFVSRQAVGAMLAWSIAMFAWCLMQRGAARLALVALGLLLACGVDAITPLIVVTLSVVLGSLRADISDADETHTTRVRFNLPALRDVRWLDIAIALGAFVLASTGVLTHASGLGEAANGWLMWFQSADAVALSLNRASIGFLVYEPLIWVFALIALGLWLWGKVNRDDSLRLTPSHVWFVAFGAAALLIAPQRVVGDAMGLVIGCALVASLAVELIFRSLVENGSVAREGLAAAVLLLVMLVVDLGVRNYAGLGQALWITTSLLALALCIILTFAFALLFDVGVAARAFGVALFAFLIVYTLASGFRLAQLRAANPGEPYVAEAAPQSLGDIVKTLNDASIKTTPDRNALRVQVGESASPALRWALRDQQRLSYVPKPDGAEALLFPLTVKPETAQAYVGSSFEVSASGALESARCNSAGDRFDCQPLAKWLVFHDLPATNAQRWIVWLRQDLANKVSGEK